MTSVIAETDNLVVREFQAENSEELSKWMSLSPYELFMMSSSFQFPVSKANIIEYWNNTRSDTHHHYSVFIKQNGDYIGHFEIKNINIRHKVGTAAHIVLSPQYRKKNLGREFANIVSVVGFKLLGLSRISLSVHSVNYNAIAAYIRAGYCFEGVIREVLEYDGKRYSLYQMSILFKEWK